MEVQKTVIQAKPVTLSIEDQESIITFVKNCWDRGTSDRSEYMTHAKECENAYNCIMPPIESPELNWMSNKCLPWVYDSSDSWYAHIHSTTIPRNDQVFTVSGRSEENHPGADMMQKYMTYRFERNNFSQQLGKLEKSLSIRNHACGKVYWRTDTTIEYNWVDEPVMGMIPHPETGLPVQVQTGTKKVRKPEEKTTFNNVWLDAIDINNFVMWPIHGDINKTTRIHQTYKHYEDLMASAKDTPYFNLDQISLDDEKDTPDPSSRELQISSAPSSDKQAPVGLNIKEAWIYRVKIGDKVYRNYIATVVNGKTLVRFQPFPSGSPTSPFIFMALRPDGDCLYGYGLNSKGLDLLHSANRFFNMMQDELSLKGHPPTKYYDDGYSNPNTIVYRPGALIKTSREGVENNYIPLAQDLQPIQLLMEQIAQIKIEFESVTVPKVVKGQIEMGQDNTATEITQAQNNSNGKMHIDAYNINDALLLPALELSYQAIYDRAQFDDSVVQEILTIAQPTDPQTGGPAQQLPLLPLPEVNIKIVGYQNVIRKQQTLMNMQQIIPLLANSPAAKYIQYANVAEDAMSCADLDKDRLLMNQQQRDKADQNEQNAQQQHQAGIQQQQDLHNQAEAAKLDLQKEKQDQDYQIKMLELELQKQDLEIKLKQVECACAASENKAAIDHHGAAIAEDKQGLEHVKQQHAENMGAHQQAMDVKQSEQNQQSVKKGTSS